MSYPLIGALVGLALGIAEFFVFGVLVGNAEKRGEGGGNANILDMIRKAQDRHFSRSRLDRRLVVRLKQDLTWQA